MKAALASMAAVSAMAIAFAWPLPAAAEPLVSLADRRFMDDAAASGMVEIVLGRVAVEKAGSDGVRRLGSQLVDDHNKANEELKQIAAARSLPLPTGLTSDQKAMVSQMKKRKPASFDPAYLARTVDDHRRSVAAFERASTGAADADVKSFAARQLPILRSHLQTAQQLQQAPSAVPSAKAGTRLPVKPVTRE